MVNCAMLSSFLLLLVTSVVCDQKKCESSAIEKLPFQTFSNLKEHGYTARGLNEMLRLMPFLNLTRYKNKAINLLEIGCGGGHAMIEMQAFLPDSKCICTNKEGYGFEQIQNDYAFLELASHFKIPLYCDAANKPILPMVVLLKGLQEAKLPFKDGAFELIVSHHALNEGKLSSRDSQLIVPRIFRLMKKGGTASLLLLANHAGKFVFPKQDTKIFSAIKMTNFVSGNKITVSILVYALYESIGMVIKKCVAEDRQHELWGCIDMTALPATLMVSNRTSRIRTQSNSSTAPITSYAAVGSGIGAGNSSLIYDPLSDYRMGLFRKAVDKLARPMAIPPDFHNRLKYVPDYVSNLFYWLNKAQRNESMLFDDSIVRPMMPLAANPMGSARPTGISKGMKGSGPKSSWSKGLAPTAIAIGRAVGGATVGTTTASTAGTATAGTAAAATGTAALTKERIVPTSKSSTLPKAL